MGGNNNKNKAAREVFCAWLTEWLLPIPMKNFLIFTCASLPHCNTHSSGAPMTYRATSAQTVAARDVPLDPLGDSTQPHAHKWGLVVAISPLCDSPDSCAKTQLNYFKLAFLSHTCAVTPTCAIAPTYAFARTFTVVWFAPNVPTS